MQILYSVDVVQDSTNTLALAGSILNASTSQSVAFTVGNTGDNSIEWTVYGGNSSDLSDGVVIQASAPIEAGALANYAVSVAPYAYYGVYIKSTVDDSHGQATLHGVGKG